MSYQSPKIDIVTDLSSVIRGWDGRVVDCDHTGSVLCDVPVVVEEV